MLCYVIYVCVCSCLCACMHCINVVTCVCAHAHIYRSVDLWICQSIDLSIYFPSIHVSTVNNDNYTHMCSHVCMYMAICIFLCLYMYLYVRVYVICVYMHDVYLHVYVFVNMCKRMQMISLYLYVHIYIYIVYIRSGYLQRGAWGQNMTRLWPTHAAKDFGLQDTHLQAVPWQKRSHYIGFWDPF